MDKKINADDAKKFLEDQEIARKEKEEINRKAMLELVIESLRQLFEKKSVEIYLVGSVIKPYMFRPDSDIDVVLKGFKGDRFEIWTQLEAMIKRNVEIILFEYCPFQDHVLNSGYKVM